MVAFLNRYLGLSLPTGRRERDAGAGGERPQGHMDMEELGIAQRLHDLRNDVLLMIACAERLSSVVPHGHADDVVIEFRRCAERTALLSRELLLAHRHVSARHRVDVNHVIARMAATLSQLSGESLRVRVELWPKPLFVAGEVTELERVFLNLALNAREAMGANGTLTFETAELDIPPAHNDGLRAGRHARVTVSDTGSGMSTDVMTHIFEPFFTTKPTGTGLGLSSVAARVRQMNGTVSLKSEIGVGTSLTVHLPLAP